jgi:hypothetical protein
MHNVKILCRSQKLLPFLSIVFFFQPLFSTNCSSILPNLILPSISWLGLFIPNSYAILFWEFYFLVFYVHAQTNIIYETLLSLLLKVCINFFIICFLKKQKNKNHIIKIILKIAIKLV